MLKIAFADYTTGNIANVVNPAHQSGWSPFSRFLPSNQVSNYQEGGSSYEEIDTREVGQGPFLCSSFDEQNFDASSRSHKAVRASYDLTSDDVSATDSEVDSEELEESLTRLI